MRPEIGDLDMNNPNIKNILIDWDENRVNNKLILCTKGFQP
jgi:hypothetical protein